jgi:type IV pilus assembly protein PilA
VITRLEYGEQGTNPRFVIAILGIGAGLALPSYQDRDIRAQVAEGLALADMAKQAIAAEQARSGKLPADNAAAGLPPADRIVGNYVS